MDDEHSMLHLLGTEFELLTNHKLGNCNLTNTLSKHCISTNDEYIGKKSIGSVVAEPCINTIARESVPCALIWSKIASATKDSLEIHTIGH